MSARYNPQLVGNVSAKTLVAMLASTGDLIDTLRAAAELYGFDLVLDDDVAFRLRARSLPRISYQDRVGAWMHQCFNPELYGNMTERGDRLLEEILELLQSHGYDRTRVATLVNYVYGRPVGDPQQEVGGVSVTLAGYCHIAKIDQQAEAEKELARIMSPEIMEKIRLKQESKRDIHGALP